QANWQVLLAQVARPPGMLPAWKIAVVLKETDGEAQVGWLDDQRGTTVPKTGAIALSEIAWARPVRDGKPGPAPRRVADVMRPGDVVMIEPPASATPTAAASAAQASPPAPPPARVTLRQIPLVQGALVSLDPTTGRVLAMVGGWSFEQSQFNRATQ